MSRTTATLKAAATLGAALTLSAAFAAGAAPARADGVQRSIGKPVTNSHYKTVTVSCPARTRAVDGGGVIENAPPGSTTVQVTIIEDLSGVVVRAAEVIPTDVPWTLTPWAVCEG